MKITKCHHDRSFAGRCGVFLTQPFLIAWGRGGFLDNDTWGLVYHFGDRDVREIVTRDWQLFIEGVSAKRPDLSSSTRNMLNAAFRNVLKVARDDGLIDVVPASPRVKQKDNPRPFFRFHPLVAKTSDEYERLLKAAKEMATEGVIVRGVQVTEELRDLILFCVHSFVRPTTTVHQISGEVLPVRCLTDSAREERRHER